MHVQKIYLYSRDVSYSSDGGVLWYRPLMIQIDYNEELHYKKFINGSVVLSVL